MSSLIVGLVLFLGVHSVEIVARGWRERMLSRLGPRGWRGLYSLISLAGLLLLIHGYAVARQEPVLLYAPPPWTRHLAGLLMLPVFPLLFAAYLPGRIKAALQHPMLIAVMLWAAAHLSANGTLADLLLFGGFLAWAVADRLSFRHRAVKAIPGASPSKRNDVIAIVAGLAVYLVFVFWLHVRLFGVSPAA